MKKCLYCSKITTNPKFCSRSCSATYTNKISPKRKRTRFCKAGCGSPILSGYTYCSISCSNDFRNQKSIEDWERITLGDMIGMGSANAGSRYPYIRSLARKKYLNSGMPQKCRICGYDIHIEVSHIKAVKDFELTATVSEVNNINNLQALCRNCHWEFDHGLIKETEDSVP